MSGSAHAFALTHRDQVGKYAQNSHGKREAHAILRELIADPRGVYKHDEDNCENDVEDTLDIGSVHKKKRGVKVTTTHVARVYTH